MNKIEKIFSDIARELNKTAVFKWDKVYSDVEFCNNEITVKNYFVNQKRDKIKYSVGTKRLSEYFEKYYCEVLKNEARSLKNMTVILTNAGHIDIKFSFEESVIVKIEDRIETLYKFENIENK